MTVVRHASGIYPHAGGTYMDPPALSRRLQVKKHASEQMQPYIRPLSEDIHGLRALMKSALPRLITTAASWALYLRRLGGSRSDLSCHQLEPTSHRAAGLLHFLRAQSPLKGWASLLG